MSTLHIVVEIDGELTIERTMEVQAWSAGTKEFKPDGARSLSISWLPAEPVTDQSRDESRDDIT